jgi:hypothetical protein
LRWERCEHRRGHRQRRLPGRHVRPRHRRRVHTPRRELDGFSRFNATEVVSRTGRPGARPASASVCIFRASQLSLRRHDCSPPQEARHGRREAAARRPSAELGIWLLPLRRPGNGSFLRFERVRVSHLVDIGLNMPSRALTVSKQERRSPIPWRSPPDRRATRPSTTATSAKLRRALSRQRLRSLASRSWRRTRRHTTA